MIRSGWRWILILLLGWVASASSTEQGRFPMTFDHAFGQTVLPEPPKRIVSLQPSELTDSLIALGRPPVASTSWGLGDAQAEAAWPPVISDPARELGIRSIGTPTEPSLEAIAVLEPDLIIAYPWQAETLYRRLSLIAPTFVVTTGQRDFRPVLRQVAQVLGATRQAETLLGELHHLQDEIRQAHGGTDIVIIRPRQFSSWLYGPGSNAGQLLEEAGLNVLVPIENASVTPDSPNAINDLSLERVPGVEADFLFFIQYNLEEPLAQYLRHPIWQRNAAVKEGRRAGVQGIAWTNHGPLGALEMLREAKHALDSRLAP